MGSTALGSALISMLASLATYAQDDLHQLLVVGWGTHSPEEIAELLAAGLVRTDAESKALALAGIARLAFEAPDVARSKFEPEAIRAHFSDSDRDVVRQALDAYQSLMPDDAVAEAAVVQRAQAGGGPLKDWEYIRYLRPNGISSDAAQKWLLGLADGPISASKFSAAEALVRGMQAPPPSLLSEVMELIRSPEYFCHFNLVQYLPRFGPAARVYVNELRELRQVFVRQMALPPAQRSVTITASPPEEEVRKLDQTISTLEQR